MYHNACIKTQSEYLSSYLVTCPQQLTQVIPTLLHIVETQFHGEEPSFELGTILYAESSVAYHNYPLGRTEVVSAAHCEKFQDVENHPH
jgi:hypothetical protein